MPMTSSRESVPAKCQHDRPCHDCPWRRAALPGWLGGMTAEEWIATAHGEGIAECHVYTGVQCAGFAIYRANVAKNPRDPAALRLPKDTKAVFATPTEFISHHTKEKS